MCQVRFARKVTKLLINSNNLRSSMVSPRLWPPFFWANCQKRGQQIDNSRREFSALKAVHAGIGRRAFTFCRYLGSGAHCLRGKIDITAAIA
jgi:hypothetical protein